MAFGSIDDVRALTGLTIDDISDSDLSALITMAQRWFFNEILVKEYREDITANAKAATLYQLNHTPIASITNGFSPAPSDVVVEAINPNAQTLAEARRVITVTALDATMGLIELAEAPASGELVYATYYWAPAQVDDEDITTAVNLLAAHLATLRVEAPGTLTIQDLDKNALVVKNAETRFWDTYVQKRNTIIGKVRFRGVVI